MQVRIKSAVETAQGEEMRSMSRNLVEQAIRDVFTAGYCETTDGTKDSSLSFVKSVVTEIINRGVLHEMLSQRFNRWSVLTPSCRH